MISMARFPFSTALPLLLTAATMVSFTCASEPCTTNCSSVECTGYSQKQMYCTNNTIFNIGFCYKPSDFCSSVTTTGLLLITINNLSPNQLHPYYQLIQLAVKKAYNAFCLMGDNYKLCCPGAESWTKPSDFGNYTAIASETTEVNVKAVKGDPLYSVAAISITPSRSSRLCEAVTYLTTSTSTTSTTTTATTPTTTITTTTTTTTTTPTTTTTTPTTTTTTPTTTTTTPTTTTTTPTTTTTTPTTTTTTPTTTTTTPTTTTTTTTATTTTVPAGRRKRRFAWEEPLEYELEERFRRSVTISTITLSQSAINSIVSSAQIATFIVAQFQAANITITVTVAAASSASTLVAPYFSAVWLLVAALVQTWTAGCWVE